MNAYQYLPLPLTSSQRLARFLGGDAPRVDLRSVLEAARLGWARWSPALPRLARHFGWRLRRAADWLGRQTLLIGAADVPACLAAIEALLAALYPAGGRRIRAVAAAWTSDWARICPKKRFRTGLAGSKNAGQGLGTPEASEAVRAVLRRDRKSGFVTPAVKTEVCGLVAGGVSYREAARRTGISVAVVHGLVNGTYRNAHLTGAAP